MLEEIAIAFVSMSEADIRNVSLLLTVFGAVVAAIITKSNTEIARAPYFGYSALIFFAVSATQIVWLLSIPAMTGGYLWVLMSVSLAASIASGFFFCRIAMARSRDAYGHGRMAFLAFIPIANFWLLLTPSQNEMSASRLRTIPLLSGSLGVLTGFVLLAAGVGVTVYIEEEAGRMEQQIQNEPDAQQAGIEFMIRANGLTETLRIVAAEAQTPITVDEVTTLAQIEATGTQLQRTYVVDLESPTMTEEFHVTSKNGICAWPAFEPILRAGGSIREIYLGRSGREIGSVVVTRADCDF